MIDVLGILGMLGGGTTIVAVLGLLAKWLSDRSAHKTTAGDLALRIATEANDRVLAQQSQLDSLQRWRRRVDQWWPRHEQWDEAVTAELRRVDPHAADRLPTRPATPFEETTT